MSTEAINNNLNVLIDPTFTNVNRLFVLAYQANAIHFQSYLQIKDNHFLNFIYKEL